MTLALVFSFAACSKGSKGEGSKANFAGTAEGGKELVTAVQKGNADFLPSLKPSEADIAALFDPSATAQISAYVAKTYEELAKAKIGGKEGQTELLFNTAQSDDFVAANEAAKAFPGGYTMNAAKFKPGITWYAWKYVKPGETLGMAFDGLTFVNNHWVWIPKPFRAFR